MYYSNPPSACDVCKKPFDGTMYDARLPLMGFGSSWGNVCSTCFSLGGGSLGTGRGQKYEQQVDGRYLKVAG